MTDRSRLRAEIQREDINKDPLVESGVFEPFFINLCIVFPDLCIGEKIVRVRIRALVKIARVQFFWRNLGKPVIIPSGHGHINIVIPGDKPFVAHGTQQGAAHKIILQAMGFAQPNKLFQDL